MVARFLGMTGWRTVMTRFCRDTAAATHVEYGLLIVGLAASVGLAVSLVGSSLNEKLTQIVLSALSASSKTGP
jgi:Flp pilus assembly pilin Flp